MSNFVRLLTKTIANNAAFTQTCTKRFYAAAPKRFYKNTSVLYNDGKYEVTLDHRKLKTPKGAPFTVESEPLAIAVATEFYNQKQHIDRSKMHISALCFTALDNPNNHTKLDMVNYLLNYIPTDTVLFQHDDEKDLHELQKREWDPIIDWFNQRFETNIEKTLNITTPQISAEDKMKLSGYFFSHTETVLHGIIYAVDSLKSIILATAVINRRISVEKAVALSRLEEEYQLKYWGRVEWAHDLNQEETQARLSAAVLFVHLNNATHLIKEKMII